MPWSGCPPRARPRHARPVGGHRAAGGPRRACGAVRGFTAERRPGAVVEHEECDACAGGEDAAEARRPTRPRRAGAGCALRR